MAQSDGQSIMVGRMWTLEHEAAGHTTSVVRADKQLSPFLSAWAHSP